MKISPITIPYSKVDIALRNLLSSPGRVLRELTPTLVTRPEIPSATEVVITPASWFNLQ